MQRLLFALGFPLKKNDSAKFKENEDNNFSSNQCRMSLCQYRLQSFKSRDTELVRLLSNLFKENLGIFYDGMLASLQKNGKFRFAALDLETVQ